MAPDAQATEVVTRDAQAENLELDPESYTGASIDGIDGTPTSKEDTTALTSQGDNPSESDVEDEGTVEDAEVTEAKPVEKEKAPVGESAPGGEPAPTEEVTEVQLGEFPLTLQVGDESIEFVDEEAYNTFAKNAANFSKAWAASNERNRLLNLERAAFEEERAQHEVEVKEAREIKERSTRPRKPDLPNLSILDPEEDNYNPKQGLANLQQFLTEFTAWADRPAPEATTAPTDGKTPFQLEIETAESAWFEAHPDVSDPQKTAIYTVVDRLGRELRAELDATGQGARPKYDVPVIYDRAYEEVTGQKAQAKKADPSESVKNVTHVVRIAQQRAKAAPKKTVNALASEGSATDPFADSVSLADFKAALNEGKLKIDI